MVWIGSKRESFSPLKIEARLQNSFDRTVIKLFINLNESVELNY